MKRGLSMICLDTSFLIKLWRHREAPDHPALQTLARHAAELLVVPVPAAGEFLEGAAHVSAQRLKEGRDFLSLFRSGSLDRETATSYAELVAELRHKKSLEGVSRFDAWIAAWALQHGAPVLTGNPRHFRKFPGVQVLELAR
jgi:predicted nucleic acid-binding protein